MIGKTNRLLLGAVTLLGIFVGLASLTIVRRSNDQEQELERQAIRHGFDAGKYKDLRLILKRGDVGRGYLSDDEFQKVKTFLKDKSPQFRQGSLTLLGFAAGSKNHPEAIQICRGMLNDPDEYVVASALHTLYRLGDLDYKGQADRFVKDLRP